MYKINKNSPEDGFEPPLKEPESFVLPLDDSGKYFCKTILTLEKLFTTPQTQNERGSSPLSIQNEQKSVFLTDIFIKKILQLKFQKPQFLLHLLAFA